ncbi:MAG: DNA polymerase III subunit [Oscillospiraceae bacterium]|jgi:DNA polymerase-3 subunit delta'|nr:DNA polymerase III subunit [Oscillospiraceae bacterium]
MDVLSLYQAGKLPRALLFTGGAAAGEAVRAVKLHLCESESKPCGKCGACVRITRKVHPDVVSVKDEMPDGSYKIKPLRAVVDSGSLRPGGGARVYVFEAVDEMSEQCQNALLKFIEEPPEYNRFIFTAENDSRVLPTIMSRVVKINADGGAPDAPPESAEAVETVKAIMSALFRKSEYGAAAAFSRVKDRQVLSETLRLLLGEMKNALPRSKNKKGVLAAIDAVYEYVKRADANPNVSITAASCAAEIYKELFDVR